MCRRPRRQEGDSGQGLRRDSSPGFPDPAPTPQLGCVNHARSSLNYKAPGSSRAGFWTAGQARVTDSGAGDGSRPRASLQPRRQLFAAAGSGPSMLLRPTLGHVGCQRKRSADNRSPTYPKRHGPQFARCPEHFSCVRALCTRRSISAGLRGDGRGFQPIFREARSRRAPRGLPRGIGGRSKSAPGAGRTIFGAGTGKAARANFHSCVAGSGRGQRPLPSLSRNLIFSSVKRGG